jgi:hypothetical protein
MWGGGGFTPGGNVRPARPVDLQAQVQYLVNRVSDLEDRVARLEMNSGCRTAPVTVWDCTLTNNFGESFAVVAQSELLGRSQVIGECRERSKFKLDCGEEHIKCQARQGY